MDVLVQLGQQYPCQSIQTQKYKQHKKEGEMFLSQKSFFSELIFAKSFHLTPHTAQQHPFVQ